MTRLGQIMGYLVLALLLAQAAAGVATMASDAHAATGSERLRALRASDEERLDAALGKAAALYDALQAQLAEVHGRHAVVYLYPAEGLPTDLEDLGALQQTYGTPLAALLSPAAVRLFGPSMEFGKLSGDEALFLAEIGTHKDLPFMALLEELARGDDFRIYRLATEAER